MKILLIDKKVQLWQPAMIIVGSFVGLVVAWVGIGYLGAGPELTVPAAWGYMIIMAGVMVGHLRKSPVEVIETSLRGKVNVEAWLQTAERSQVTAADNDRIVAAYFADRKAKSTQALADKLAREQREANHATAPAPRAVV